MEKKYYIACDGVTYGPFTAEQLAGQGLNAGTLVWTEGMDGWAEAGSLPELAATLASVPPVPPAPSVPPEVKSRQRTWIVGGIVGFILIVLFAARPSSGDHREAVSRAINGYVSDRIDSSLVADVPLVAGIVRQGGRAVVSAYVFMNLDVSNYLVCSVGKMEVEGRQRIVSFGILGKVFTFDKRDVAEAVSAPEDNKSRDAAGAETNG